MEALTKTRKIGGSLMVTVPKIIVEEEGLEEDQTVVIEIKKMPRSGFGLFKGIGPFTKADKFRGQLEG